MSKIVATGGGTGIAMLLKGLKKYNHDLIALVPMIANGGSTGRLRDDLGVSPVGNIRQSMTALSETNDLVKKLGKYRFTEGELKGHSFGNIYLAALEKITGSLTEAIKIASNFLEVKGKVIPLTLESTDLCIELEDGQLICGEMNVSEPKYEKYLNITKVFVEPEVPPNKEAIQSVLNTDYLILGPGDFYFLLSSFLIQDFVEAIKKTKAKKIFVCNLINKQGLTNNYHVKDYVEKLEQYLGTDCLDYIVYNKTPLSKEMDEVCNKRDEIFVEYDEKEIINKRYAIIKEDLLWDGIFEKDKFDCAPRSCVRHDRDKLGKLLNDIISGKYE